MQAKILSLNVGVPAKMEWNGRSIVSSMLKSPVPGPLIVHETSIEGNMFGSPQLHGTKESVIYAFGMRSILQYMKTLGRTEYEPGALGENVTLDDFDEDNISVGDIFRFGEVVAQATFPRIPCGKVSIRMQHEDGLKNMQECGRSGIYFRILKPGKIFKSDLVSLMERASTPFMISDLYRKTSKNQPVTAADVQLATANGAFPKKFFEKWGALTR